MFIKKQITYPMCFLIFDFIQAVLVNLAYKTILVLESLVVHVILTNVCWKLILLLWSFDLLVANIFVASVVIWIWQVFYYFTFQHFCQSVDWLCSYLSGSGTLVMNFIERTIKKYIIIISLYLVWSSIRLAVGFLVRFKLITH